MRISYDYEYLTRLLSPAGFVHRFIDREIKQVIFTRKVSGELFEQIEAEEGWQPGFRGYVIGGSVSTAIVPGATFLKGMGELIPVVEVGPVRGSALISNDGEFRLWADRLAAIAPAKAAELTERVGPKLLADNAHRERSRNQV